MSARILLHRTATVILLMLPSSAILAYPIPPAPLWRLVHDADVIVLAKVTAVDENPPHSARAEDDEEFEAGPSATAKLSVIERWKGESPTTIATPFEPNMVCPQPPTYDVGSTVLAFLTRNEEGVLLTAHLSYGTIYPEPQEIAVFAARVKEALALQADPKTTRAARMEWLVSCAENRATRWHGLYELAGSRKPSLYEDDDEIRIKPAELLTDEHRARIAQGFVREPQLDYSVVELLRILDSYRDEKLDQALRAAIERELESEKPKVYVLESVVPLVFARAERVDGKARPKTVSVEGSEAAKLSALRAAWAKAKPSPGAD